MSGRTACRMEVLGKVSSLAFDATSNSCLTTTILNGAHAFHMDDAFYGTNLSSGMSTRSVESYPYSTFGSDPLLTGCFLDGGHAVCFGSSSGSVTTVSRRSRGITGSFLLTGDLAQDDDAEGSYYLPIRHLDPVPGEGGAVLACSETTTAVVDVERSTALCHLQSPVPRSVGAVALTASTFAVANYDGKVLLYDTRGGLQPCVVLSVADQITCLARCPDTAQVCVGTVAGRVFTLRCTESAMREQGFGTGKRRSPLRSVALFHNRIVAGDIGGKLSILDASDVPNSTKYWTAEDLLNQAAETDETRSGSGDRGTSDGMGAWREAEVTAVSLAKGIAWAAFSSPDSLTSHVVALPA